MSRTDLVLCTMPPASVEGPSLGPHMLLSWVRQNGFSAIHLDLNLRLFQAANAANRDCYLDESYFNSDRKFKALADDLYDSQIDKWIGEIKSIDPRWLGLSVLSSWGKKFFLRFCERVRKKLPDIKIVAGGGFINERERFRDTAFQSGLIDAYVVGEGEYALIEVLKGNLNFPGVNGRPQTKPIDLGEQKIPDYAGVNFGQYGWRHITCKRTSPVVYIEGSRGCIRKCRFCSVPQSELSFRFRPAHKIVEELKILQKTYGISRFQFSDSLINGSITQLRLLCELLIELRKNEGLSFELQGYFVVRPEKLFSARNYKLLRDAGFTTLALGIESGSEKVRLHMRKKFSNDDVIYNVEQCHQLGIRTNLLFMIGYPTETDHDFEQTLKLLERMKAYKTTVRVKCSWQTRVHEINSQLNSEIEELRIYSDGLEGWYNENVNVPLSIDRFVKFIETCHKVGLEFGEKKNTNNIIRKKLLYIGYLFPEKKVLAKGDRTFSVEMGHPFSL